MNLLFTREVPPLVGTAPPRPLWIPAAWTSPNWPLLDDPASIRQWLECGIDDCMSLAAPGAAKGILLPGKITTLDDAFLLVRHLIDGGFGGDAPPEQPEREFFSPDDFGAVGNVLETIRLWLANAKRVDAAANDKESAKKLAAAVYLGNGKLKIGKEPPIELEIQEDDVIRALLKLGGSASLKQLADESNVSYPAKSLKKLREKYPVLRSAIFLPGGRSRGGYRTSIQDGRTQAPQNA